MKISVGSQFFIQDVVKGRQLMRQLFLQWFALSKSPFFSYQNSINSLDTLPQGFMPLNYRKIYCTRHEKLPAIKTTQKNLISLIISISSPMLPLTSSIARQNKGGKSGAIGKITSLCQESQTSDIMTT